MTVSSTTSRADANGNGVTTAFTASFRILDQTHITVLRTQISTGVATTLALTTDYTVAGVGGASFTVTCVATPTADQRISILRNVPFTQLTDYVENDPFPAASHEDALDKLTMEVQQLDEAQDRAITLAPNSTGISTELPAVEANALIGWNSAGTALENYAGASSVPVSTFMATVLDDTTAAAARTTLGAAALGANLFTGLQSEAEGAAVASAGTIDIWATDGNTRHITGSTGPITSMGTAPQAGAWMKLIFDSTPTLTQGTNLNLNGGGSDIAIEAGDVAFVYADTTTQLDVFVIRKSGSSVVASATTPSVRQCVLEGPVTSAGLPNYGASTGSSTVTVVGTLKATAAYGELDRTGSIANPSWTGLNSAGSRYFLYLTVNADGTCTTGSSLNLQPTVQWGGTYSTTNGQPTFNIQEMTGKVGNGVTADQAYRVYVGEVTVSGANVVDAIYWYQLKRRYQATSTSVPSTTRITMQHHLGFIPDEWSVKLVCTSTDLGYGVGEEVEAHGIMDAGTNPITNSSVADRFDMGIIANSNTLYLYHKTTGALTAITAANWDTKFYAKGSW